MPDRSNAFLSKGAITESLSVKRKSLNASSLVVFKLSTERFSESFPLNARNNIAKREKTVDVTIRLTAKLLQSEKDTLNAKKHIASEKIIKSKISDSFFIRRFCPLIKKINESEKNMKIGIFGGTFDPPHKGHVKIAETAVKELGLDELIILPSGDPPHKTDKPVTDKMHRWNMTKYGFEKYGYTISDYEIKKESLSYTCETLEHFAKDLDGELYFIIGGDSLKNLPTWKCPDKILSLAKLYVIGRDVDAENEYTKKYPDRIIRSHEPIPNVSSTDIRLRRRFLLPVQDMLAADKVGRYMDDYDLYKEHFREALSLSDYININRYMHTYGVARTAMEFAPVMGVDPEKAFIAALFHDIAKNVDPTPYQERLDKEGVYLPASCKHGFVGSYIAEDKYGVTDKDVLNAIKYHTTGRRGMSQLEKLVFLSDAIENVTRAYELSRTLRKVAENDFELAVVKFAEAIVENVADKDRCTLTEDAVEDLRSKYYGTKSTK